MILVRVSSGTFWVSWSGHLVRWGVEGRDSKGEEREEKRRDLNMVVGRGLNMVEERGKGSWMISLTLVTFFCLLKVHVCEREERKKLIRSHLNAGKF